MQAPGNLCHRATPTLLFYCPVAGKSVLMSSRNVYMVHFRLFLFSYLNFHHQSHYPELSSKTAYLKTVSESAWSLFLKIFSPFLVRLLFPPFTQLAFSLNAVGFCSVFLVCCPKQDTFLPLTNGEKRRRIMFQPCLLCSY